MRLGASLFSLALLVGLILMVVGGFWVRRSRR